MFHAFTGLLNNTTTIDLAVGSLAVVMAITSVIATDDNGGNETAETIRVFSSNSNSDSDADS